MSLTPAEQQIVNAVAPCLLSPLEHVTEFGYAPGDVPTLGPGVVSSYKLSDGLWLPPKPAACVESQWADYLASGYVSQQGYVQYVSGDFVESPGAEYKPVTTPYGSLIPVADIAAYKPASKGPGISVTTDTAPWMPKVSEPYGNGIMDLLQKSIAETLTSFTYDPVTYFGLFSGGIPTAINTPAQDLAELVPALKDTSVACPACVPDATSIFGDITLARLIQHVNDEHKWSREQIADWLDSLEGIDLQLQAAPSGD